MFKVFNSFESVAWFFSEPSFVSRGRGLSHERALEACGEAHEARTRAHHVYRAGHPLRVTTKTTKTRALAPATHR